MSNAAGFPAPIASAISVAMAGVCLKCETVATITPLICSGVIPASAMALPDAAMDIAATVSSGDAQWRLVIPERERIHSSDESIVSRITSLGTTRLGR
jgi:hypothetical protein